MQRDAATGLSPSEVGDFQCLAGLMIPASTAFAVPGADDPVIFRDIVSTLGRDLGAVQDALAQLVALAGGPFAALPPAQRQDVAARFLDSTHPSVLTLGRVVLQCYYRDDRVLVSLGLEPRAPFPLGHKLEQGDWSLLDAVRHRPKLWRDAPRATTER